MWPGKYVYVFIALFMFTHSLHREVNAQVQPAEYEVEIGLLTTLSSERHQAFWLVHNRWGIFDEGSANALASFSTHRRMRDDRTLDWGGGVTLLARGSGHSTAYLHEGYLKGRVGFLQLEAGRLQRTYGHTYESLSSGSTGMSRNATPVPRITLSVPEFEPVPFTDGWLEFKGHFSHGWLDGDRVIRNSLLHDKSLYLQTGGDLGVKFYAGLIHFAEWGGTTQEGREFPASFRDFRRVIIADEGDETAHGVDQANALGAHNGLWDWGLRADIADSEWYLYYQHLFDDGSGLFYRNLRDGLYGLGVKNPFGGGRDLLTGILWEFLYTKHQTGPGLTDPTPDDSDSPDFCADVNPNCGYRYNGRDDYYNNYVYLTGWSHRTMALGNPLFLTRTQLDRVAPDIETYSDRYFASTRIVGHHIGFEGWLHRNISYRLFTTYSRHYGTYWGLNLGEPWGSLDPGLDQQSYFFNPPQHQWYLMLETIHQVPYLDGLTVSAAVALDRGDLFNNVGVIAGFSWRLF